MSCFKATILSLSLLSPIPVFGVDVAIGDPPGKMYDIGGYDLQMYCSGSGAPTVVVDTGLGSSSMEWLDIQQHIQRNTRICTYDRAGYGWSDEGPGPRTAKLLASELHQLLQQANETPPYVLVGHSFGGYIVQYYAKTHPREVVGMVLVESSHPEQASRLSQLTDKASRDQLDQAERNAVNAVNPVMLSQARGNPRGSPQEIGEFLNSRRKALYSQMDELEHFARSGEQVAAQLPLPEMPLIVLSRGQNVWGDNETARLAENEWQTLQKELAQMTRQGERRIAKQSGHYVHLDQPALVIDAINDVVRLGSHAPGFYAADSNDTNSN